MVCLDRPLLRENRCNVACIFIFSRDQSLILRGLGLAMLSFVEAANLRRPVFWFASASYDRMASLIQIKTKTN